MGEGNEPGVQLGPINNAPQFERVKELVEDAIDGGATAVAGGAAVDGPGYFFQPTILADVHDGTRIVDEEQFGPALPVIPYRDIDDAIGRANATHFGLSGSVWSDDTDRAVGGRRSTRVRHRRGSTPTSRSHRTSRSAASSGRGLGVENGPWGLDAFTDIQVRYTPEVSAAWTERRTSRRSTARSRSSPEPTRVSDSPRPRSLAKHGARVIMACRNAAEGRGRRRASSHDGDRAPSRSSRSTSPISARSTRARPAVLKNEKKLDLLLNNAGLMAIDEAKTATASRCSSA